MKAMQIMIIAAVFLLIGLIIGWYIGSIYPVGSYMEGTEKVGNSIMGS